MTDEVDFHEYQDLVHSYDFLEPENDSMMIEGYGEFLTQRYGQLSTDMRKFWNANEKVGRGRQGTKWRVKYKRALGKRDLVEQVYSELSERGFIDEELS